MRKLFLIMMAVLVLTACGSGSAAPTQPERETDADGNWVKRNERYTTIYADNLPCVLPYNNKKLIVTSFKLYQTEYNYENILIAVADIDLSALSNKEYHWIFEDKELDYYVFMDGGKNEFNLTQMEYLGGTKYTDAKQFKASWITGINKKYKNNYNGTEVTLTVSAKQKEENPYEVYYALKLDAVPAMPKDGEENYTFISEKIKAKTQSLYEMMK